MGARHLDREERVGAPTSDEHACPRRPRARLAARCGVGRPAAAALTGCGDDEEVSTPAAEVEEAPHFAYSGAEGPARWGSLDESYALCAEGDEQSPIDLSGAKKGSPAPVSFDYLDEDVEMENNGHSVEAVPDPGSTVEIDGEPYDLEQFHFHASSEHLVDGESYPLEFHFVNRAADDSLAVFGLFAEQGRRTPPSTASPRPSRRRETRSRSPGRSISRRCCRRTPTEPSAGATRAR